MKEAKKQSNILKLKCKNCNKSFFVRYKFRNRKFCSLNCYFKWNKGKNHFRYKRFKKQCLFCGKTLFIRRYKKIYKLHFCNTKCKGKYQKINLKKENNPNYRHGNKCKKDLVCPICKKKVKYSKNSKYCSLQCSQKAVKGRGNPMFGKIKKLHPNYIRIKNICKICGKKYKIAPRYRFKKKFCSRKCFYKSIIGEKHHYWRYGYYPRYKGKNWFSQRKKAIKRDKFCQYKNCKLKYKLEVHHKKPFVDFVMGWIKQNQKKSKGVHLFEISDIICKKANSLSNLICYCKSHHSKTENNRKKRLRTDFIKFLYYYNVIPPPNLLNKV